MANCWFVLVSIWVVSTIPMAVGAVDDGQDCPHKDGVLKEITEDLIPPSECVMTCTILTYRALLETLDRQNIRFKDSEAGGHGEYCWSTKPLCISEKPFFHAYIVIPVNESLANVEFIGLKANLPHHNGILNQYNGPTPLSNVCGILFDVTPHLMPKRWPRFCMQVVLKQSALGNSVLNRCPPFMAVLWESKDH